MCLSNAKPGKLSLNSSEPLDVISEARDLYLNQTLLEHHATHCDCGNLIKTCVRFYQRFRIRGRIFHSTSYRRKGLCNSYAIQYLNKTVSASTKCFGEVVVFFSDQTGSFALTKVLAIQHLLSNYFKSSMFYESLRKPLDAFYHMVTQENRFVCIPVENVLKHCVLFRKRSSKSIIITPVSSYEEHD